MNERSWKEFRWNLLKSDELNLGPSHQGLQPLCDVLPSHLHFEDGMGYRIALEHWHGLTDLKTYMLHEVMNKENSFTLDWRQLISSDFNSFQSFSIEFSHQKWYEMIWNDLFQMCFAVAWVMPSPLSTTRPRVPSTRIETKEELGTSRGEEAQRLHQSLDP